MNTTDTPTPENQPTPAAAPPASETTTPLTDYEEKRLDHYFHGKRMVYANFARDLERRLSHAEAVRERDEANAKLKEVSEWDFSRICEEYFSTSLIGDVVGRVFDEVWMAAMQRIDEALGGHGYTPYESDGSVEDAMKAEVSSVLEPIREQLTAARALADRLVTTVEMNLPIVLNSSHETARDACAKAIDAAIAAWKEAK